MVQGTHSYVPLILDEQTDKNLIPLTAVTPRLVLVTGIPLNCPVFWYAAMY
jgi:hypothetical protein